MCLIVSATMRSAPRFVFKVFVCLGFSVVDLTLDYYETRRSVFRRNYYETRSLNLDLSSNEIENEDGLD